MIKAITSYILTIFPNPRGRLLLLVVGYFSIQKEKPHRNLICPLFTGHFCKAF